MLRDASLALVANSPLAQADVVIEDGVQLQGCVIGRGVVLGAGVSLRDCQVAAGTVVPAGAEHRAESLRTHARV